MEILKVTIKDPEQLIKDIVTKIDLGNIRSWIYKYDSKEYTFYHKGSQYINHIYFEYEINDDKGFVKFILESDRNEFVKSITF